jgi:two-component system, sensor histidine kinase PdtaS
MQNIFRYTSQSRHFPAWARYAITTLVVLIAFGARYLLWGPLAGYPFLLFFPAVILVAILFDHGTGVYAVGLSTVLTIYFFLDPPGSLELARIDDLIAVIIFALSGTATAVIIESLHRAYHDLRAAHDGLKRAHDELQRSHKAVAASEHEKDVLLQELAHRVKNDMATLISLLQLQARSLADPVAKEALGAAADRIRVLGSVHAKLDRRDRSVVVDCASFITSLCDDLRSALIGVRPLALRVDAESHAVSHSRAVAVGLIANELVTNAVKYAFPGDRDGIIEVVFDRRGDEFCLIVEDDGIGMGDPPPTSGIGQRLVRALTLQLGGRFEAKPRLPGTSCIVHFPVAESGVAREAPPLEG